MTRLLRPRSYSPLGRAGIPPTGRYSPRSPTSDSSLSVSPRPHWGRTAAVVECPPDTGGSSLPPFSGSVKEPLSPLPPDHRLSVLELSALLRDPAASPSPINRFVDAIGRPLILVVALPSFGPLMYCPVRPTGSPKVHYISGARRDTAYGVLVLPLQGAKTALHYRIKPF